MKIRSLTSLASLANFPKLFIFLFLITLYALLFKTTVYSWEKDNENPIFTGTPDSWDKTHVLSASILFENDKFKMWYTGHDGSGWRIGYAYSADGKTNWSRLNQPILVPTISNNWERDVSDPYIIHDSDEIYKIWYVATGPNWQIGADRFRLKYAYSLNGIDWQINPSYILMATSGSWDSGGLNRGITVIHENNGYKMWYAGVNEAQMGTPEEKWMIGYATSPDGINWTKYPSNENPQPVIQPTEPWELNSVSYPNVVYENGTYHMWYAATSLNLPSQIVYAFSNDGINWNKPAAQNPVLTKTPGSFDQVYIAAPFVIMEGNQRKMWYSGYDGSRWHIGYATEKISPLSPIVFLPGLEASWNHQFMILGQPAPQEQWHSLPGLHFYDGFIQTLKNAGYKTEGPDKNLFTFFYNWTQPIENSANDLKQYIQTTVKPPLGQKISLVGHSLGGLVARTYVQNNPNNQIDKVISLGSPHSGTPQIYYAWEGGQIEGLVKDWQKIGLSLLLHIRNPLSTTPMDAIRASVPALKDLLPTFNYLKFNSSPIPVTEMDQQNFWLTDKNNSLPAYLLNSLYAVAGNIPDSTLRWITVKKRTWIDEITGLWADGQPTGKKGSAEGDKTVLLTSSLLNGANQLTIDNLDHGQIINSPEAQSRILEILNLNPSGIVSSEDNLLPALVFQLASAAVISRIVDQNSQPVGETDGKLAIVFQAKTGDYRIDLKAITGGIYHLHIGQIINQDKKDEWTDIAGSVEGGEEPSIVVRFDPSSPLINPLVDPDGKVRQNTARVNFDELEELFEEFELPTHITKEIKAYFSSINFLLPRKKYHNLINLSYHFRQQITYWQKIKLITEEDARRIKNHLQLTIGNLEFLYLNNQPPNSEYNRHLLEKEIKEARKLLHDFELWLKRKEKYNPPTADEGSLYLLAEEKLNRAVSASSFESHINALGSKYLSLEGISL